MVSSYVLFCFKGPFEVSLLTLVDEWFLNPWIMFRSPKSILLPLSSIYTIVRPSLNRQYPIRFISSLYVLYLVIQWPRTDIYSTLLSFCFLKGQHKVSLVFPWSSNVIRIVSYSKKQLNKIIFFSSKTKLIMCKTQECNIC